MHKLFTFAAAAALSIAPPVAAGAAEAGAHPNLGSPVTAFTNGPVSVQTCNTYTIPVFGSGSEFATIPDMRWVEISFVNRYDVAAKKVRFSLSSGSDAETFVDSGTFSTGTIITHGFSPGAMGNRTVQCTVDSVVFADGSAWTRQG